MNPRLGWAAIAVAGVALEAAALRDQIKHRKPRAEAYTLTATTAALFRTDTELGRAIFCRAWHELSKWFVPHVCKESL